MIYNLDKNKFKEKLIEFNKTYYGKCIFVICYSFFIVMLLLIILNCFIEMFSDEWLFMISMICLISFLVGSYGFYKELRIFVSKK